MTSTPPRLKEKNGRRATLQLAIRKNILECAERAFSETGFAGTTIEKIAKMANISKQNLLYYFPNKLNLYKLILDDIVIQHWLVIMNQLADSPLSLDEALSEYIEAKLEFSRLRPYGSKIFAMEIICGGPNYHDELKDKVRPVLIRVINRLKQDSPTSRLDPDVPPEHLLFILWAATQSYADFDFQIRTMLGHKRLVRHDYDRARSTINKMVQGCLISDSSSEE